MENEIKVGDYIRTHGGNIYKCTQISASGSYYEIIAENMFDHTHITRKEVKRHSKNVLELLERGDIFVTRSGCIHKVEDIRGGTIWDIGFGVSQETTCVITAIMTKEQFEKISYKVGEGTWNS